MTNLGRAIIELVPGVHQGGDFAVNYCLKLTIPIRAINDCKGMQVSYTRNIGALLGRYWGNIGVMCLFTGGSYQLN